MIPEGREDLAAKEREMKILGMCAEMLRNCKLLTSLCAHRGTAWAEQRGSSVNVFHPPINSLSPFLCQELGSALGVKLLPS